MKQMKKWIILLLVCILPLSALADAAHTLSPAEVNVDALKRLTFGDKMDKAVKEADREMYSLDPGGPPFCSLDVTGEKSQRALSIVKEQGKLDDLSGVSDDVEPSGRARLAITREEAVKKAEEALNALGITDYVLQSVTAHGKMEGALPQYKVAFGQTLNGRPLYWSLAVADLWQNVDSNRLVFGVTDEGVFRLRGYWSRLTPTGRDEKTLSPREALNAFEQSGVQADTAEACWLIVPGSSATAIPAYRYQNAFVNAVTGERVQ